MSDQESEVMSPPTEQGDLPEQESTWPKKIGIISLIYAIGGLLCQVVSGLGAVASDWFMSLFKMEIEVPLLVKLTGGVQAVLVSVLGILMLVGSIKLLRRQRTGTSLLKTWVALRLVVVLLALVVGIFTAPAQIEMQKSILVQTNKKLREAGRPEEKIVEEAIQRKVMLTAVIGAGILTIYPLFLGFYLSRKKITEEVQDWQ